MKIHGRLHRFLGHHLGYHAHVFHRLPLNYPHGCTVFWGSLPQKPGQSFFIVNRRNSPAFFEGYSKKQNRTERGTAWCTLALGLEQREEDETDGDVCRPQEGFFWPDMPYSRASNMQQNLN
jgi:hypothetical protein